MKSSLIEMFAKSSYTVLPDKYIYAKVATVPEFEDIFMITKDTEEITVVAPETKSSALDFIEKNEHLWKLLSLNLAVPFTAGTLALSTPLALK